MRNAWLPNIPLDYFGIQLSEFVGEGGRGGGRANDGDEGPLFRELVQGYDDRRRGGGGG